MTFLNGGNVEIKFDSNDHMAMGQVAIELALDQLGLVWDFDESRPDGTVLFFNVHFPDDEELMVMNTELQHDGE